MSSTVEGRTRLRFEALGHEVLPNGACRVTVRLASGARVYDSIAEGLETHHGLIRAATRAALAAMRLASEESLQLDLIGVKSVRAFDGWVVVTRINASSADSSHRLLGAASCEMEEDLPRAAVLAVLDAGNRVIERYLEG